MYTEHTRKATPGFFIRIKSIYSLKQQLIFRNTRVLIKSQRNESYLLYIEQFSDGFRGFAHAARLDISMLLTSLFVIINGSDKNSLDNRFFDK